MANNNGYASNQFLNLKDIETYSANPIARTPLDNPEFLYPGNLAPNIYDNDLSNGLERLPVQRGFIRGIFPEIVSKIQKSANDNKKISSDLKTKYKNLQAPIRRCFFQFNPSMILRSVQASSTTLNPLLQNPNQLLQAIPGQASFEFQLLFNREREVSGQVYKKPSGDIVPTKEYIQLLDNYGATNVSKGSKKDPFPYSQDQVGDLGVLVDLYILDSIIGQSITQDTMDTIRAYWQASKTLRGTGEKDAKGNEINPYKDEDFFGDSSKYVDALNNVLGNSAFLNPMPVRIVFSSLFMVEGFVTASAVAFHKFSREMVPTVCQVTLSVQALYIGFAKKDSYITQQLESQIKTDLTNAAADEANTKTAKNALKTQTQAIVKNMGFSYEGWEIPKSGGAYYIYDGFNRHQLLKDLSLNSWFKAIHDFNVQNEIYKKAPDDEVPPGTPIKPESIPYTFSVAQGVGENSFNYWTSQAFKDLRKATNITDIKIDSTNLYIFDVKDLPSWATKDQLKKYAEDGLFDNGGSYHNATAIAKCEIMNVKDNNVDALKLEDGYGRKTSLSDIVSDELINGTKEDPYDHQWVTSDMTNTLDSTRDVSKYFGDSTNKTRLLMVQSVTASFSGNGGGIVSVTVYKADVTDIDPNAPLAYGGVNGRFGKDFHFGIWGKKDQFD